MGERGEKGMIQRGEMEPKKGWKSKEREEKRRYVWSALLQDSLLGDYNSIKDDQNCTNKPDSGGMPIESESEMETMGLIHHNSERFDRRAKLKVREGIKTMRHSEIKEI